MVVGDQRPDLGKASTNFGEIGSQPDGTGRHGDDQLVAIREDFGEAFERLDQQLSTDLRLVDVEEQVRVFLIAE